MKFSAEAFMRGFVALLLVFPLFSLGCESTTRSPETAKLLENEHPIDGLNRDVSQSEAGSIRDPYSRKPPPIQRDYATER
jgi:hypothetical protein